MILVTGLLALGLALMLAGADEQKTATVDCRPRKLTEHGECVGEDNTWTECNFYFRVTGVPEQRWCAALQEGAQPSKGAAQCQIDDPSTWRRADCSVDGVSGDATCFECSLNQHETARRYLYAYSRDCKRGLEQVTCNVSRAAAVERLGQTEL